MDAARAIAIASTVKRVAIYGARPATAALANRPASFVPAALAADGVTVIPIPHPAVEPGDYAGGAAPVTLAALEKGVDALVFFKRPDDLPPPEAVLAAAPRVAWLQSGIRAPAWEAAVAAGGVEVVSDRCIKVDRAAGRKAGTSPRL
jgi:hypothetical protein